MSSSDSKMGFTDINYQESTDTNSIDNGDYDEGAMCLTEEVDKDALRIIRDNFSEVYKRIDSEFWVLNSKTQEYEETDEKTALTIINELYHSKLKSTKVTYHYTARLKSGRRFAKNSLQGLSRRLRHTIAKNIYYDIDIVNAHPTFLLELCKKLEFNHPILEQYINNREELLESWVGTDAGYTVIKQKFVKNILSTTDLAKKYFLKVLNGGGNGTTDNQMLNEFYRTQQIFLDMFYKRPDFKQFRDRAYNKIRKNRENADTNTYDNQKGSALNHYLCEVENKVLIIIEKYLKENNIKYGTLCFDGLMVYKHYVPNIEELLSDLEHYLYQHLNYNINLKCKDMNEDIDISDLSRKEDIKTTDEDYALYLLDTIKDDYLYDSYLNEFWFYNEETALWSLQKMKHIRTVITKYLIPYVQKSSDPKLIDEETKSLKSNPTQTAIVKMCEPYIEKRRDEQFIKEHFNVAKGLFPIANKQCINLRTSEVRPRRKTDYFTLTTNRRIVEITPEKRKEMLDYYASMLKTDSIEYRDNLITVNAYILTGENDQKVIANYLGKRDGGKSTFLNHHQNLLESFGCYANNRIFIEHKNTSTHDSELFNLRGKRMACLSETSSKERYNITLMKAISGGDKKNIRGAGDKESTDEKFHCVMVIASNEVADFSTDDREDSFPSRLWCFDFCNRFERNSAVVDKLNTDIDAYFTLLCEYAKTHYYDKKQILIQSPQVKKFTDNIVASQDTVIWWCKKQSFVPGEYEDYIEKTSLFEQYKNNCFEDKKKNVVGKTEFYKRFQEYYNLQDAVQIKDKNEFGFNNKIRGYRYIKLIENG
jgi:phage/plasmid-associated DNA primase